MSLVLEVMGRKPVEREFRKDDWGLEKQDCDGDIGSVGAKKAVFELFGPIEARCSTSERRFVELLGDDRTPSRGNIGFLSRRGQIIVKNAACGIS